MSGADLLLFRRMRGIWWGLLVVAVIGFPVIALLVLTVPAQFDLYDAATVEEIGGPMTTMEGAFGTMAFAASIAAVIVGATAGSVDYQRGVLRDLVLAGRSRLRIVSGRLVAALVLLACAIAVAVVSSIVLSTALAPNDGDVVWGDVARLALAYMPGIVVTLVFSAGIAMLVGGRGPAIAITLVFSLIVDNVLAVLPKVGAWWQEVSMAQAELDVQAWVRQGAGANGSELLADSNRSGLSALAILAAWAVLAFVAGVVRLSRRDL